ncbi:MAG: hypothetical protein IK012_05930 [Fibrobacter sp.]|uniref:hypothetical protein n=1 Tax=Fibrobacter sp. TaxID=35828 RepID=UPI0025BCCD89|nr:hypothetical protein [Fibrobacter sp.]MBR4784778.1 hypothetical protein [Fibrobacter sp.]
MKNLKISLLAAGATIALLACSSLEVSNPEAENFPVGWSLAEYISVNPDLRALQIMDKVTIINSISKLPSDSAEFMANPDLKQFAITYAGFTEESYDVDNIDKRKHLKNFNINGVSNEAVVFDSLLAGKTVCAAMLNGKGVAFDSTVIERQYLVYGKTEGRPFRKCGAGDQLVKKGECQADASEAVGYSKHLYCASEGVTYCIDCDLVLDDCPEVIVEPESSSSEAAPESSEAAAEVESSSSEAAPVSSETVEPESSAGEGGETAEPQSSSATEPVTE